MTTETKPFVVLVAHPSAAMRDYLRRELQREACVRVEEAATGVMALDLFFLKRPNAALVHINLPDRNAIEVLRCMRQADSACELRLLSRDFDPFTQSVAQTVAGAESCSETGVWPHLQHWLRKLRSPSTPNDSVI